MGAPAVATYDDLIGDPSIEGVVIASSTGSHAELVLRAAQAGKHVFCEKPLSLEREVSAEVVRALDVADVKLQVGFHRRFDPSFSAAADRARAGELGQVYLFRASQRDMAPPKPAFLAGSGGIFIDMGIHDFDAARWLVGEVTGVSAYGTALSDPGFVEIGDFDTAVVVLTFANGALGVLDISRVAGYGYDSSAELMGSRATVRIEEPFLHGYEWRTPGTAAASRADVHRRYAAAFAWRSWTTLPAPSSTTPGPWSRGPCVGRLRPGPGGTRSMPPRPAREPWGPSPEQASTRRAVTAPGIDGGAASDGVAGSGAERHDIRPGGDFGSLWAGNR